ncbi:hypothetical protein CAEBREN_14594 [Caenorhabditis brenneri]|uniref:DUF38 domain-containing protein n=1 Tax=Caenorhabditis brenneri TaxID=135651 RepID=G0MDE9_CAEBE|nr:hypothetical protein CAEBREN_14594 [Caenorhabditis brenneri]
MQSNRPLGYPTLPYLLPYLNSNLRFSLACRSLSIKKLYATIPSIITDLIIQSDSFIIDNTTYKISIIEVIKNDNYPDLFFRKECYANEFQYEVDDYGLKLDYEANLNGNIWLLKQQGLYEKKLKEDPPERLDRDFSRYHLKKNRIESPFAHYLQLTIMNKDNKTIGVYRLERNHTITEALNYLLLQIVQPKTLVRNLSVDNSDYLTLLSPRINYEQYPLKTLIIGGLGNPDELIQQTAKLLVLSSPNRDFSVITNNRVHFQSCSLLLTSRFIDDTINWATQAGKHASVGVKNMKDVEKMLNAIRNHFVHSLGRLSESEEGAIQKCIVIQIADDLELVIYSVGLMIHAKTQPSGYAVLL